jgi:hypothetical protein
MKTVRRNLTEWTNELNIKFYSSSKRRLEVNDLHIRKITAKEFVRILRTSEFTFNNRNTFNKKLISFSKKYDIKKEHIAQLLELKKDDYVKFKVDNKIQIGRYQGEINNGKDLLEIEINGNGALNFLYIEKNKVLFPTKKEISKVLKKEIDSKTKRKVAQVSENYLNRIPYNNYYE